jgi:hypothetical protein
MTAGCDLLTVGIPAAFLNEFAGHGFFGLADGFEDVGLGFLHGLCGAGEDDFIASELDDDVGADFEAEFLAEFGGEDDAAAVGDAGFPFFGHLSPAGEMPLLVDVAIL